MKRFALIFTLSFTVAAALLEALWLSKGRAVEGTEFLYNNPPMLIASFIVLLAALWWLVTDFRRCVVFFAGVALMAGGMWANVLYGYYGKIIVSSRRSMMIGEQSFAPEGLRIGKYSRAPGLHFNTYEIEPELSDNNSVLRGVKAKVDFFSLSSEKPDTLELSDHGYTSFRGLSLKLMGIGYAPRYELMQSDGTMIETAFVTLELFPPGEEDSFRLYSPHTYYVRYYPGANGGELNLRVARNKDLVFNERVAIGQEVVFENVRFRFAEVRPWTYLVVKRAPGSPYMIAGLALFIIGAFIMARKGGQPRLDQK